MCQDGTERTAKEMRVKWVSMDGVVYVELKYDLETSQLQIMPYIRKMYKLGIRIE